MLSTFIERSIKKHGLKYDYSRFVYINTKTKGIIICPSHGEFLQSPDSHMYRCGCPKCRWSTKYTTSSFIEKANVVHKSKFGYELVDYINSVTKIIIKCPIHGEFLQRPADHLNGQGCPRCVGKLKSTASFIKYSKMIHGEYYNYDETIYLSGRIKLAITCVHHGKFLQLPGNHLAGQGCPKCKSSRGEVIIRTILKTYNVTVNEQHKFKLCINPITKRKLKFDFYLPDYNCCIEFDGEQHYKPHSFSSDKTEMTKLKNFIDICFRDNIKTNYCTSNNIKLIRIPYFDINNIPAILDDLLKRSYPKDRNVPSIL